MLLFAIFRPFKGFDLGTGSDPVKFFLSCCGSFMIYF